MDHNIVLKLAVEKTINELTNILQLSPGKLVERFDREAFTDAQETEAYQQIQDVNFIVESIQEALNLTLDARKRLILLGLYRKSNATRETTRQEVQVEARD